MSTNCVNQEICIYYLQSQKKRSVLVNRIRKMRSKLFYLKARCQLYINDEMDLTPQEVKEICEEILLCE